MKTCKGLMLLLVLAILSGASAWADDFYVISGGGAPVGTMITSVPYTIDSPGFYYFAGNLEYSGTGAAISINADNVTLDLMGCRLAHFGGKGTTIGIYMSGRSNVNIRNGTVLGFFRGVHEEKDTGANHRLANIRVRWNTNGIVLNGKNHLIRNCSASDNNMTGIFLGAGQISDCVAGNNYTGIYMKGPGGVLSNTAYNNSNYNYWLGAPNIDTTILVDRNSAVGLSTNYFLPLGVTQDSDHVYITILNSGAK